MGAFVRPCRPRIEIAGRPAGDACEQCGHLIMVHDLLGDCTLCEAVDLGHAVYEGVLRRLEAVERALADEELATFIAENSRELDRLAAELASRLHEAVYSLVVLFVVRQVEHKLGVIPNVSTLGG